ncbi:hypothetical protein EDD86DRAFT_211137 [Gorgonomyces haynaldii]|nr:hypothetical protein EDD86DRAFT_211137 [Gorgonomyces haynaldii]
MLNELFKATKVKDLLKSTKPITLDSELPLHEACAVLAKSKISSAPVYDAEQGAFIGMLDYRDIVAHVLTVLHKIPPPQQSFDSDWDVADVVKVALSKGPGNVSVKMIANMSSLDPLVTIREDESVKDAVDKLHERQCHRLVVLDTQQPPNCIGIFSESLVIALVVEKFSKFSKNENKDKWELGKKSVEELGLLKNELVTVSSEDNVLDAMYKMHDKRVSSVAIVGANSTQIVGVISMSDVKEILSTKRGWSKLMTPAEKFFVETRNKQMFETEDGSTRMPIFTVFKQTSFIDTLAKMAATKTHRIWVVDHTASPANPYPVIALVSLSSAVAVLSQSQ